MKPGSRLVAGLSALGLASAFLTGCGAKDPDEGLCEEVTAALESRGIYLSNPDGANRLYDELPPDEQRKVGEEIQAAAQKYNDSEYAELMDLMSQEVQLVGEKRAASKEFKEKSRELEEFRKKGAPVIEEKLPGWGEKCKTFSDASGED